MIGQPFNVTHASGLHAVARELARLHDATVRTEADEPRTVRLSVLTLVAVCTDQADAELAAETVGHLAASHPARALIITASADGADSIEADLAMVEGRGDAWSEVVRLTVTGAPALHLVSVVGPLLLPDVPVYLWMVGAPPLDQAFGEESLAICERLIIDTGAYTDPQATLATLAREATAESGGTVADLAWARSRTWRELIAQSLDPPEVRRFARHVERISILVSGMRPSAQARLVAGWLSARLGWSTASQPAVRLLTSAASDVPTGDILAVRLDCRRGDDTATIRVERHDDVLYTALTLGTAVRASRTVPLDTPDVVHLVGGLIEEPGEDGTYREAVMASVRLIVESTS